MQSEAASSDPPKKHPVFNDTYEIFKSLGEGNTSKVYLARSLADPRQHVAIKIIKEEFLKRDASSITSVENEITIIKHMKHPGIVRMLSFGDQGTVKKPSGRLISNLIYIVMEFVQGGLLFDLC